MRTVVSGLLAATLIAVGSAGCAGMPLAVPGQQAATPGPAPQKAGSQVASAQAAGRIVTAAKATRGQVRLVFTYTGTVQPRLQVNLSPRASGRLDQLLVDIGSEVKAGDTIANLESSSQQLSVQQAEANFLSAQARLAAVTAPAREEDLGLLQADLDTANAQLSTLMAGPTADRIQTAQTAVETAKANLTSALIALDVLKAGPTQSQWADALSKVESAKATMQGAETKLAQVKAGSSQLAIQNQQATVAARYNDLQKAKDNLENWRNGSRSSSVGTSNSQIEEALVSAQASYDAALATLNQMLNNQEFADLQSAQNSYNSAKANYDAAVAGVDQLKRTPIPQDVAKAQSAVDSARATLADKETALAQLRSGPTQDDITVAKARVTKAELNLAIKQRPPTDQDVQTARAALETARVSLATARANLVDTTLAAPFSGVITQRSVSPGAIVSGSTSVVTLVSTETEIPVNIEESRLGQVKVGLPVEMSASAYPGQTFRGKVGSISPSADPKSHTFVLRVLPEDPQGKLKPGMYVEARVTADEHTGVLVPRDAATQRSGKDIAFVIVDGKVQVRQILLGLPVGDTVEILNGISADEQVIVVGYSGLNEGDPVRIAGAQTDQPAGQQRPPGPGGQPGQGSPGQGGQSSGSGQGRPGGAGSQGGSGGPGGGTGPDSSGAPARAQ